MVETLKSSLKDIKNVQIQDSFEKFPCQIICLANEINFNLNCSAAITKGISSL